METISCHSLPFIFAAFSRHKPLLAVRLATPTLRCLPALMRLSALRARLIHFLVAVLLAFPFSSCRYACPRVTRPHQFPQARWVFSSPPVQLHTNNLSAFHSLHATTTIFCSDVATSVQPRLRSFRIPLSCTLLKSITVV